MLRPILFALMRRFLPPTCLFCVLISGFLLAACAKSGLAPPRTSVQAGANLTAPAGPLPQGVTPLVYTLALALDPNRVDFSGTVAIAVRLDAPLGLIWLHGQDLEVGEGFATDAAGGRHRLRYSQVTTDGVARLDATPPLPAGVSQLHLRFAGTFNAALTGLYKVASEGESYIFSQFEPLSARRAFPSFDEPRFKTPFQISLTVPQDVLAVSNTAVSGQSTQGEGHTTWTFAPTQPLPTYLTAFAAGRFDAAAALAPINSVRTDTLPIRGISIRGKAAQMAFAVGQAAGLLAVLEEYFQAPYPFDKLDLLAVPDFAAGAMENAGAITSRDWMLLLDPGQASASQKHFYYSVMAHELSHQWFGDWTTMAWWDDLWLNESFATWMGQRTAQQVDPLGHYDWELIEGMHNVMHQDALAQARRIHQPCPTANDVHSAFDGITYQKGGAILNMFEHYMGPRAFAQGVRSYLQAHPYATATTDDFLSAIASAHGDANTKAAFYSFLEQTGVPQIEAEVACAPGQAELVLRQRPYVPLGGASHNEGLWHIPVCFRASTDGVVERRCVLMRQMQTRIYLGQTCPTWLMPNADGAGYYFWHLPPMQLAALTQAPLTPPEQMSLARNTQAAYEAGTMTPEAALARYDDFIDAPYRNVATSGLADWKRAVQMQLSEADRPKAKALLATRLRPRAAALAKEADAKSPEQARLRQQLLGFLAQTLDDRATRLQLSHLGERLAGWPLQAETPLSQPLHQNVVDPELGALVLTVAAETHGQPFVDHLLELLAPEVTLDAGLRLQIVGAVTAVSTPAIAARMRLLALQPQPLRANELMQMLRNHMRQPKLRGDTWHFIKQHFLALKARLPDHDGGNLAALTGFFCDKQLAADAQAFFAPYINELAGGPRALAMAQEEIGLCAAQSAAQTPGVVRYFQQRGKTQRGVK